MNDLTDPELWNKIAGYDFDDPQAEAPFSVRLARENGWTPGRAKAAIDQYRRFIYLVCISDDMLSPSPDVDKVWHLHLTYTKDYWKRFCDETLAQEVHHYPSRGASEGQGVLRDAYARTLELLSAEFGEDPVAAVWPGVDVRERPLLTGALGPGSAVLPAAEIAFGIALALIVITASLLWSNRVIGDAPAVGLCVAGFIAAISLLPIRCRRRRSSGASDNAGCGGGSSSDGGDGGGCGGGD
ncbi:hypothetical protein EDC40_10983 [Aminobacter aminovorans]|uniref:Uncharacterized conserved protein n=1 Tax=Aminobacter aminovorans TaxID=83263 RepID=A0A380WM16_AMIAI|nr:hypothetical protein [Aminobacter aminovorans]TCS24216.1 hypothetical protein EDC40_10983 [Aminobacter aminovorans]SUU89276.1 Uncharacterized conserved protein [Aminobacter aminovorans]